MQRGIDFIDAVLIWDDPDRQERTDTRTEYGEVRYQTIGKGPLGVLFVVYTIRVYNEGEAFNRIISVRPAKKKEMVQYELKIFKYGLSK